MNHPKDIKQVRQTRPKQHFLQNNRLNKNIFVKKPTRSRSNSVSPDSSFDNFGYGQKQKDQKNAHSKQEAYDKMRQIQLLKKNITTQANFQDLFQSFCKIVKNHVQWALCIPKRAISGTGKIIMSNGMFFTVLIQILKKNKYLHIFYVASAFKQNFGQKLTENKDIFQKLVNEILEHQKSREEEREKNIEVRIQPQMIKKQDSPIKRSQLVFQNIQVSGRKSILKKSNVKAKSVSFNPQVEYPDLPSLESFVQNIKKQEQQKKKKLQKIKSDNSFLLDYLEINDIYDEETAEIVGIIDQIQDKYAILLVKEKLTVQAPPYVKTRKSYSQRDEFQKQVNQKQQKQIICIGLMKTVQKHESQILKAIESKYQNLSFFNVANYNHCFMQNLPNQSNIKSKSINKVQ